MNQNEIPQLVQDRIYAAEHLLLQDPVGRAVERALQRGIVDDFLTATLRERVNRHKISQAWRGPFTRPHGLQGDFCQGFDESGQEIFYPSAWRNEPTLSVATTGSGKTNLSRYEALQWGVTSGIKGMWLFDLRKAEFGVLQTAFASLGISLEVVRGRDLKLNPLQLPLSVDPVSHASHISDSLVSLLDLPPVAARLLFQSILVLYRKHGVLDGGTGYPTLFDLLQLVESNSQANRQAREATILRLETLLVSLRDVFIYRKGYGSHELAQRFVSFQLQDITEIEQNVMIETLLMSEFSSRIARGYSNQSMNFIVSCDESSRLIRDDKSSLSAWIGLIRGTGIGLTVSNQSADVARTILSNTPNKLIGRLASAQDYEVLGSAIGLTREQKRWLAVHLKQPGCFLASLGRYERPFLFSVPYLQFAPEDILCDADSSSLRDIPVVAADEFADWQPSWARSSVRIPGESTESDQIDDTSRNKDDLTIDEVRLLEAIVGAPGLAVSEYPKQAGMGKRKAIDTRRSLKKKGYINEEAVQQSVRGRPALVLTPTTKALEVVGQ